MFNISAALCHTGAITIDDDDNDVDDIFNISPFSSFWTWFVKCTVAGLSAAGAMVTHSSVKAMVGKAGTCSSLNAGRSGTCPSAHIWTPKRFSPLQVFAI